MQQMVDCSVASDQLLSLKPEVQSNTGVLAYCQALYLFWWYNNVMLLYDYFNAAILNVRELRNGVSKLQRIDNETKQDHNKRRADYLFMQEQMKKKRQKNKKGA